MEKKSTFGLSQNIAGLLCYAAGFVTGIIFLASERDDKVVRFHAMQSILWSLALAVANIAAGIITSIIGWVPILGGLITTLIFGVLGLIGFASWLYLMLMAYSGKQIKLPVIGDVAKKQVERG